MFGPRYQVNVGELVIEMGPPKHKEEVEQLAELLSDPVVSRHLALQHGLTVEDEQEWYERTRNGREHLTWLLFDVTDGQRLIIGNTSLHSTSQMPLPTMTSGFVLARREYWGKRIASTTHRVRTWHGFNRLGLSCIRSAVNEPNVGSRKALESVGYVVVGVERNACLDDGKLVDRLNLECVNPDPYKWDQWWHSETVPRAFLEARERTQRAINWVRAELNPLN